MADAIDKAVRAQGGGVVKPHQVKAMILAARRAFKVQSELGLVDDGTGFDAWRKATLHDVTGGDAPESFRTVTQRDYAAVLAYFGELAGDEDGSRGGAEERRLKAAGTTDGGPGAPEPRPDKGEAARALWALDLEEAGLAHLFEGGRGGARRYTDALFWKIHGTERSIASPRQIWAVIFTLRNRARKLAARHPREKGPRSARSGGGTPVAPGSLRAFSRVFPRHSGDPAVGGGE